MWIAALCFLIPSSTLFTARIDSARGCIVVEERELGIMHVSHSSEFAVVGEVKHINIKVEPSSKLRLVFLRTAKASFAYARPEKRSTWTKVYEGSISTGGPHVSRDGQLILPEPRGTAIVSLSKEGFLQTTRSNRAYSWPDPLHAELALRIVARNRIVRPVGSGNASKEFHVVSNLAGEVIVSPNQQYVVVTGIKDDQFSDGAASVFLFDRSNAYKQESIGVFGNLQTTELFGGHVLVSYFIGQRQFTRVCDLSKSRWLPAVSAYAATISP